MIQNFTSSEKRNYTGKPQSNYPGKPQRSQRTKTAFMIHKGMMFCAFWMCMGIAVSDLASNPNTVIETPGALAKVRHQAAFINENAKRKNGERP